MSRYSHASQGEKNCADNDKGDLDCEGNKDSNELLMMTITAMIVMIVTLNLLMLEFVRRRVVTTTYSIQRRK